MNEYIKDRTGKIIGKDDGKVLRDRTGKIVAKYDEYDNTTRDRQGNIVGKGDQRKRLL